MSQQIHLSEGPKMYFLNTAERLKCIEILKFKISVLFTFLELLSLRLLVNLHYKKMLHLELKVILKEF
jgi:hypothetical protein